jgi:hypothetical protein
MDVAASLGAGLSAVSPLGAGDAASIPGGLAIGG